MPPPLPDRYRLEVRLGRVGDVEEWLATDTTLDRPVLIRVVGPETSPERRREFLDSVRAAAGVSHTHLAAVYGAGELADGAFSVSEWTGGVTLADRLASGGTIPAGEFLSNASGLASALAALHETGEVHGALEARSILYSYAHPAKLAGFGHQRRGGSAGGDVADMAATLEEALTGFPSGGAPPSEVVDGLSVAVDRALRAGRSGGLTARGLADALSAAPTVTPSSPDPTWSWRWLIPAATLVGVAVAIVGLGSLLVAGSGSPILFPVPPRPGTPTVPIPATTTEPARSPPVTVTSTATYDPFGTAGENDELVDNLIDGDPATAWRTERYQDPLHLLKPGVGATVEVRGVPVEVVLVGLAEGTAYALYWAQRLPGEPAGEAIPSEWERIAAGRAPGGSLDLQVPSRSDGFWLVWFTHLPPSPEEGFVTELGEVRFRP
ncbi:MAG: protein kinase [Acidimicrobiia bacterium]